MNGTEASTSSSLGSSATPCAQTPQLSGRIAQLDGLRGIAIGLVLIWHYFVRLPGGETDAAIHFLRKLFYLSWSGVDLFFVLSGFLIGGILLDNRYSPRYFRTFYTRRALRILPPYLLLLVPFLAANASLGDLGRLAGLFAGEIPTWSYGVFLQNLHMAAVGSFGAQWMSVTWSLAIEEQFYVLLPLTLLLVPRRRVPQLCLASAAAAFFLRSLLALGSGSPAAKAAAAYVLLPSRMDGLLLGVLGAWLVRETSWRERLARRPRLLPAVIAVGVLGAVVASFREVYFAGPPMSTVGYSWLALFYLAVLLASLETRKGALHATLTFGPLRALGSVSYFVYLFHIPFLQLVHFALYGRPARNDSPGEVAATFVALAVLLAAAAGSWRLLERPLIAAGRKARY